MYNVPSSLCSNGSNIYIYQYLHCNILCKLILTEEKYYTRGS